MWVAVILIASQGLFLGMLIYVRRYYRAVVDAMHRDNKRLSDELHMWRSTFLLSSPKADDELFL